MASDTKSESGYSVTKAGVAIIAAATGIMVLVMSYAMIRGDHREVKNTAILVAGNDKTPNLPDALSNPAFPIKIRPDALKIFLGTNLASAVIMPHTIVRMGDDDMLKIDKQDQDIVIKLLKIYDSHDQLVVRIDEGGIWVEKSAKMKRPNPSTLVVVDYNDTELLHLTYLNPKALSITGTFRHPGISAMTVDSLVIEHEGMRMAENVFKENKQADIVLGKKKQIDYIDAD